jgi:hypothetical protein
LLASAAEDLGSARNKRVRHWLAAPGIRSRAVHPGKAARRWQPADLRRDPEAAAHRASAGLVAPTTREEVTLAPPDSAAQVPAQEASGATSLARLEKLVAPRSQQAPAGPCPLVDPLAPVALNAFH